MSFVPVSYMLQATSTSWRYVKTKNKKKQHSVLEVQECSERVLTQGNVCDDTAKYERGQKGQGDNEAVEKAVIAFSHTVPDPRAVVIKSFWGGGGEQISEACL